MPMRSRRLDISPVSSSAARDTSLPVVQIIGRAKSMSLVLTQYKDTELNDGSKLLKLLVAKG